MPSDWVQFPCSNVEARWRYLDDGSIEIDGMGPIRPAKWPSGVNLWRDAILAASAKYGVPAHWIAALIAVEDPKGDPRACSPCAACPHMANCTQCCAFGVMQLTEGTAAVVAKSLGLPPPTREDLFDPALSIELGVAHFAGLLKRYKGDFVMAATAYNAGGVYCLSATSKCQKGYWGVCTDGSPYPLWAIQGVNGALANGFPPTVAPPPLEPFPPEPVGLRPVAIVATAAIGAFLAYMGTQRTMQRMKRPIFAFGTA